MIRARTAFAFLLAPLLLTGPAAAQGKKRKGKQRKSQQAVAYEKIKTDRAKYIEDYTQALFDLAEDCVDEGWKELGMDVVDRVRKLHAPPKSRRKTAGNSGVMVDEGGGAGQDGVGLKRAKKKELSPEEQKKADSIAKWIKDLSKILKRKKKEPKKAERGKFETHRKRATGKFIDNNIDLAKKCVSKGYPSIAYELLLWALQFDPDNKSLRKKLLKQKPFKDRKGRTRWYSAFEIKKAKQGLTLHPEYGWVTAAGLKALKAGKMNYNGKWLPKAKVEELRRNWDNHWIYETEHYQVHTNAPLADAVEFGREVENLYRFFFRTWVAFYALPGKRPDANLVFGGGMKPGNKKLWLNYYRSRESYLEVCRTDPVLAADPLLQQSAGFYDPNTGKAYFYREEYGPNLSTIYHEVSHQIFGETGTRGPQPPTWMVEGLAVFMEDPVVRGELGAERLLAGAEPPPGLRREAPRNINVFMKSTAERDVFHGAQRGSNYKTAGAVVHFFMIYKGGIYRNGFIRYCQLAYRNQEPNLPTKTEQIYELCGVTPDKLQEQWVEFNSNPDLFDF